MHDAMEGQLSKINKIMEIVEFESYKHCYDFQGAKHCENELVGTI